VRVREHGGVGSLISDQLRTEGRVQRGGDTVGLWGEGRVRTKERTKGRIKERIKEMTKREVEEWKREHSYAINFSLIVL
jgi:hypothetical protein